MIDERALHFHRADTVAGDVDDIVDAPEQPEVAVGITFRAVAGDVDRRTPFVPVLTDVALGIAVNAAEHRRPRPREREQAAADLHLVAALIPDFRLDAGKGTRRRSRPQRRNTG